MIRVAVLTISDSCAAGVRQDASGPAVARVCESQGWTVVHREVLPDDRGRIQARLRELADAEAADLILTTGGTGIAARDTTPEATRAVIEKELPGLGELMRAEGLRRTRRAVLSRAVAGVRGRCLIVNLPGSPKGAVESLNAILDLVPHIAELLNGQTTHGEGA
ncbi:MAG: molybdenum cofactor biosynthesis protein [Bryobacteraceae bacterium]|nr:MAG: molybdenum cofactor biosynthesis protein [Bryobacteraceae bacterium]